MLWWMLPAILLTALLLWWVARWLEQSAGADWGSPWLNRIDGLNRLFCRYYHGLRAEPVPLPETGPALLVSNHVSGLDPLLLAAACKRPLRFIIAAEQYNRFGLKWLFRAAGCIPVERGARPQRAFRAALKALDAGEVVALFPHGRIHLDTDPPRRLKPGVARMARIHESAVWPVRIEGVRAQGWVVAAVAVPSRVTLHSFEPLPCYQLDERECLEQLARLLDGRAHRPVIAHGGEGPANPVNDR